jgi:hypothetical protein
MTNKRAQFNSKKKSNMTINKIQVKQMIRGHLTATSELKNWISNNTGLTVAVAGTVYPISQGLVLGDTYNQRDGQQVFCKEVEVRIAWNGGLLANTFVRAVLVRDNMNIGVLPTVAEILNSADFLSNYNPLYVTEMKRFTVLADQTLPLCPGGQSARTMLFKHKGTGRISFLGTTDVNASNGKGSLHLLLIGTATSVTVSYNTSIRFTDH